MKKAEEIQSTGGTLALTWEDCGDATASAHISDVQPNSLTLGETTTIHSSGTIDKGASDGTFSMAVTAGGGIIKQTYTGDLCEKKVFKMPLGIGQFTWAGLDCPVAAGSISIGTDVFLSAVLPSGAATADLALTALDQDSNPAICVNMHMKKAEEIQSTGGTLALTWEDCGDATASAHISDVQPNSLTLGETTTIHSSGTIDKGASDGTFSMAVTAGGGIIKQTYTGDLCEKKVFKMPLGIGQFTWAGFDCPVSAGAISVATDVFLSAVLPSGAATADLALTATDQDGNTAICLNMHMKK